MQYNVAWCQPLRTRLPWGEQSCIWSWRGGVGGPWGTAPSQGRQPRERAAPHEAKTPGLLEVPVHLQSPHMTREKPETHALFLGEGQGYQEVSWRPSVDIYRAPEGWLLKFDLAGVQQQDIEVCAAGRSLTVRGIRRDWSAAAGQSCYHMEILYNRFERTVELPCEVGQAALTAEYREGMLLVRVITRESTP